MKGVARGEYLLFGLVLVATGLLGCGVSPRAGQHTRPQGEANALQVLFVGNSHVRFQLSLPQVVKGLAACHPENRPLSTFESAPGGFTLTQHANHPPTLDAIKARKPDILILQESSGLVDGRVTRMQFIAAIEQLRDAAQTVAPHCKIMLYMVHAPDPAAGAYPQLRQHYIAAARQTGADIIPAAAAWDKVRKARPGIRLTSDGNHFNDTGCYLTACTFYATLFDRNPEGLPHRAGGLEVAEEDAVLLQQAAWEATVESQNWLDRRTPPRTAPTTAAIRPGSSKP